MANSVEAGPCSVVSKLRTPSVRERPRTSARATRFGRYSSLRIASSTRSRVSGRTCGLSCSTRDTVWCDTPASLATSAITAGRGRRAVLALTPSRRSLGWADVLIGRYWQPRFAWRRGYRRTRCYRSHQVGLVDLTRSPRARLRPLAGARIDGGFWADRRRLNRERLLVDGEHRLEEAGNFENLRA